jgi:hypothetical protein
MATVIMSSISVKPRAWRADLDRRSTERASDWIFTGTILTAVGESHDRILLQGTFHEACIA